MQVVDDKVVRLKDLGTKCRAEDFRGYSRSYAKNGDYHGGAYDTAWVSPFTKTAHAEDSPLFLVLHDWWADKGGWPISRAFDPLSAERGYGVAPTNARLETLLRETYGKTFGDVFITNVWPFVRPKDGEPPAVDYDKAFWAYCWPQIQIVSPQLVVCLGKPASETFRRNLGGPRWGVGENFQAQGVHIWYQSHPGDRANHATEAEMFDAWAEMKASADLR